MDLRIKQVSSSHPLRILVLEDESEEAESIFLKLEQINPSFQVELVKNRISFISKLYQFVPHMVVADLSLDSFSGKEALTFVRRMFPDIPFFLIGRDVSLEEKLALLSEGATEVLCPSQLGKLSEEMEKARVLHADSEHRLKNLRVMSQLRTNIEALEEIRASLGNHDFSSKNNLSVSIREELDSSITYLQHLSESLRKKVG